MNIKEDLISIIVPVYNSEKSLRRCIDSILSQTYNNFEIVIVNDGSTDESESLCQQYLVNDERIHYIKQKNSGVSEARNNGIKNAHGTYISFLDSDDYIEPNFFEILINTIKNEKSDICICRNCDIIQSVDKDGKILESRIKPNNNIKKVINVKSEEYDFYDSCGHWTVWGVLYKKTIIENLSFNKDLFVGEDTYFLAEVIKKSNKITLIDEFLLNYIIAPESLSHGVFDEKKYTELDSWKKIEKLYDDRPKQLKNIKAAYAQRCINIIKSYYLKSEYFNKNYYKKTIYEYRKNIYYILRIDLKCRKIYDLVKHIAMFAFPNIIFKIAKFKKTKER